MWLGVNFASAGHWMEQVALGWLVYEMTDSPFVLGAVTGLRALPFLFLGPIAGVVADRYDRKAIMIWSQVAIFLAYVALVVVLLTDLIQVWHLFVFTTASAVAWSFNAPARHALIPVIVPKEDLLNAIALNSLAHNLTRVVGPSAGGILMAYLGGDWTFVLITLTMVGVLGTTVVIKVQAGEGQEHHHTRGNILQDLVGGFRYVLADRLVFGLMLIAAVPMIFGWSYVAVMPVFARDIFGMDARGMGELMAASGIGAVASTVTAASLGTALKRRGLVLLGSGIILGFTLIGFGLSPFYWLSMVLMLVIGLFSMLFTVLTSTGIQMATPREYMGRVMSIYMLDRGLMPLGAFAAGALAEVRGGPFAMVVMGAMCVGLIILGGYFMPAVRKFS